MELNPGQKISLSDGSYVSVRRRLGGGGQGDVYLVDTPAGEHYALKWYTSKALIDNAAFYRNLRELVSRMPPYQKVLSPRKLLIF